MRKRVMTGLLFLGVVVLLLGAFHFSNNLDEGSSVDSSVDENFLEGVTDSAIEGYPNCGEGRYVESVSGGKKRVMISSGRNKFCPTPKVACESIGKVCSDNNLYIRKLNVERWSKISNDAECTKTTFSIDSEYSVICDAQNLDDTRGVRVRVLSGTREIEGARVVIYKGGVHQHSLTTGSDGRTDSVRLTAGSYQLDVLKDGYKNKIEPAILLPTEINRDGIKSFTVRIARIGSGGDSEEEDREERVPPLVVDNDEGEERVRYEEDDDADDADDADDRPVSSAYRSLPSGVWCGLTYRTEHRRFFQTEWRSENVIECGGMNPLRECPSGFQKFRFTGGASNEFYTCVKQ